MQRNTLSKISFNHKPSLWKKVHNWFFGMSFRERVLVGASLAFAVFFGIQQLVALIQENVISDQQQVLLRKNQLQDVGHVLKRYNSLRKHRDVLQTTYAKSQMTFEQVSNELDRIVRDAIGNDNYELKKPHAPEPFGFDYEKQEFSLIVKSLTLEQLVKLLYQVEHGEKPIFLSKVDINRALSGADFSAVLEIYSISKASSSKANES